MSKSTYRRLGLVVALAASLAGCSAAGQPTVAATPTVPWACLDRSGAVPFAVPDLPRMRAAQVGTGIRAVVFSNQSDEDACAWADFATELAGLGYRAVLYDYTGADPQTDLAAVVHAVSAAGATSIALVGASKGAKTSIVVAADATAVDVLISLSAESTLAARASRRTRAGSMCRRCS